MPKKTWSAKRERQYAHVKESLLERGKSQSVAEEIAARVVNKERARKGETAEAQAAGRTVAQLRNEASQRGIKGRSSMNKAQLERALRG